MTTLRQRIRSGERHVGTVLSLADVALAELVADSFDLVWIDLEHGALGPSDAQALTVAVQSARCGSLVRLPHWSYDRLAAVLDAGPDGVVAPCMESAEEARALVSRLRYPPSGVRGYGPRRAGRFGRADRFWTTADAEPACVAQIESAAGVAAAAEIAAVPGVDALVVGCSDLSFAFGAPLDTGSEAFRSAVADVREAAHDAGVAFGVAGGGTPAELVDLAGPGAALVVFSSDVRLYARAADDAGRTLRAALAGAAGEERRAVD